jgi:hypothetical protein
VLTDAFAKEVARIEDGSFYSSDQKVRINLETDRVTNRFKHKIAEEPPFKLNDRLGISAGTLNEFSQNRIDPTIIMRLFDINIPSLI